MKCERRIDPQHDTGVGKRKNLSPREESNLMISGTPSAVFTELLELMESKAIKLSLYVCHKLVPC